MGLDRYQIIDSYTLEELKRKYTDGDTKDRIRLLRRLYSRTVLPFEIALMAVKDSNVEVRQWIARNGRSLDYAEREYIDNKNVSKSPEKNLEERLKNDPDPFVRACLRENPEVFHSITFVVKWREWFEEASHLGRLALVRNRNVVGDLIERIFDPEDNELGIELNERLELALAFLTNEKALERSRVEYFDFPDGWDAHTTTALFNKLWVYASRWQDDPGYPLKYGVYMYVGTDDDTKAQIYQKCTDEHLRQAILHGASWKDKKTLKLSMKDNDDFCRYLSYMTARLNSKDLEKALKSKDTHALSGLAVNESLSIDVLGSIEEKLSELDDLGGARSVERSIERIRRAKPPKDPEDLFGYEGRQGNFLEDKVDFIGKLLLTVQRDLEDLKEKIYTMSTSRRRWF